jgi:hypothetical protein
VGCSQKVNYTFLHAEPEMQSKVPVQIIWYKKIEFNNAWKPYKELNQQQASDMRKVILYLIESKISSKDPVQAKNKLSILFYNGYPEQLTVREVYFDISENIPMSLLKILEKQEQIESLYYYPYINLGPDHYTEYFERIHQSQKKELPIVGKN